MFLIWQAHKETHFCNLSLYCTLKQTNRCSRGLNLLIIITKMSINLPFYINASFPYWFLILLIVSLADKTKIKNAGNWICLFSVYYILDIRHSRSWIGFWGYKLVLQTHMSWTWKIVSSIPGRIRFKQRTIKSIFVAFPLSI